MRSSLARNRSRRMAPKVHNPDGWLGRLRLADSRLLIILAVGVIFALGFVLLWPSAERAREAQCRTLYTQATSATDTSRVDDTDPLQTSPKFTGRAITCGTLRQAGRL